MVQEQKRSAATLSSLKLAIDSSWGPDTSSDPVKWSESNRAYGQCAVTALVIQDFFGGSLLRVEAQGPDGKVSHYYNRLRDGNIIDLTRRQFPEGTKFSNPEYREREYVLSYPATASRYEVLRNRVSLMLTQRREGRVEGQN